MYKGTGHICSKVSSYQKNKHRVSFSGRDIEWHPGLLYDAELDLSPGTSITHSLNDSHTPLVEGNVTNMPIP